ncbi:MAG: C25 family cysteine peptidase, partial [Promethearchaeota archaeon]
LGYDVQIVTTQYILSTYSGYDNPEKLRNFVNDAYQTNGTVYFLFLGDCDVVPAREVYDPAGGSGLDNGTEPSDFYFECLDGNWDSNGNHIYGEMDDTVDLFPEVMVGRIPVQTPAQAEDVLMKIISVESDPESGGWFDDFLLIGPECFTPGDGVGMLEEYLNQKYLVGSFFDTHRLYPSDGSLSHANTISRLNAGVGIVDFFDHGAYDTWVGALDASEALALANGNKSMFAFCMACETAAFDAESVEPVIGEAFFRGTAGGAHTYIGATRVAWAGDHVFDGFHNRFWAAFMEDALAERVASPKAAFHQALNEMATVFDTDSPYTRETLYHAIYFGDPTLHMVWRHNVSTDATPVEVNEETTLTGECTLFQSGVPLGGYVNVTVRDPLGAIVYDDALLLDGFGVYNTNFYVGDIPGYYKVETRIWEPFPYCEETQFYVGSFDVTVQLDSAPVYNTSISFSGTSNTDGSGIVRVTDSGGNVIATEALTVSSGVFSGSVTVDAFGWVSLHVDVDGITASGGASVGFKIVRGEVLIISDNAGNSGPSYPGGWADYNFGDGVNYGEIREALDPEYGVTEFHTMRNGTPTLSYLQQFDAVAVSVGDNYNAPLIASLSFLLDVLQSYHDSGGHIMFEGGAILNALSTSYGSYLASLFHVSFTTNYANSGGLYLANSGHPITSGMPSSVLLQDDLGSARVDVFSPAAEATHVSSYSGAYSGGSAIAAMSASETLGAIVVIGFAVDAIESDVLRMRLIQNAVGFLLHPTVMLSLSDYAVPYGTSDTIEIQAFEASTGTPIAGVTVEFTGCGIDSDNFTLADGTCSIFINPSSFGEITVDASKPGFLNYSTSIIIYDKPKVSVDTIPDSLEKDVTQTLTVITTEFYEGTVLPGCFVNISGCGVSRTGYSNSSGMIDFTVTPNVGGRILLNVTLPGYVNSTSYIGVPITAAIVRSYFTMYPEDSCWDQLMTNWDDFGDIPLIIDYESLTMSEITLGDLLAVEADVIVIPYGWDPASTDEISAILDYVRIGKGLVATSSSVPMSPDILASFMGITEDLAYTSTFDTSTYVDQVDVIHPEHPIMRDLPDPFSTNYGYSFWPASGLWDGSAVNGFIFDSNL